MTLREVVNQVYDLSVDGYFNRIKFTKQEFSLYVWRMMRTTNKLIFEIALPDGWWYMSINRWNDNSKQYDYYIPDTKEDSEKLYQELVIR